MVLSDAEEDNGHALCKQMRWKEAERETGRCFDSLRTDISALDLSQDAVPLSTMEKAELMNIITQVIISKTTMGKSAPWDTHLAAAMKLFEEIMATSEARLVYRSQSQSKFASVLLRIGDPLWSNPWPSNHIWSPEQTGFRFCAGYQIFVDIMASAALRKPPQLASYYPDVLAKVDDGQAVVGEAETRLSAIVGSCNWVATSIADVSALVSWKQEPDSGHQDIRTSDRAAITATSQRAIFMQFRRALPPTPLPSRITATAWIQAWIHRKA